MQKQETKVIATCVAAKLFSHHKGLRIFIAEASELPQDFDPLSQVWNDACDSGFVMIGQRTGKGMLFTFKGEDKNIEGETIGWNFVAEPQFNKGLIIEPVHALIIND